MLLLCFFKSSLYTSNPHSITQISHLRRKIFQDVWKFTRPLHNIGLLTCSHSTSLLDHDEQGNWYLCAILGWLVKFHRVISPQTWSHSIYIQFNNNNINLSVSMSLWSLGHLSNWFQPPLSISHNFQMMVAREFRLWAICTAAPKRNIMILVALTLLSTYLIILRQKAKIPDKLVSGKKKENLHFNYDWNLYRLYIRHYLTHI